MRGRGHLSILVAALLCAALLVACGGSDESAEPAQTTTAASGDASQDAPARDQGTAGQKADDSGSNEGDDDAPKANPESSREHDDSGGGSKQLRVEGGDNSIQDFGAETTGGEFDEAAAALHGFLDARVARRWGRACAYMAQAMVDSLQQLTQQSEQLRDAGCAQIFAALSGGVPDAAVRDAAVADVVSLRAEDSRGFVIYRGARNAVFAMPMVKEGQVWKVGALAGTPIG